MDFYYAEGNQQKGPVTIEQMQALRLPSDTLVWREGMSQWTRADSVPELASLFAAPIAPMPAPTPTPAPQMAAPMQPQSFQQQGYPTAYQQQQTAYPQAFPQQGYPQQPMYPQAPVYPQQMGYAAPMGYGAPQNNAGQALGITSMILGILALPLTCAQGVGILFAIAAIICGHIGHAQSRRANGQANGMAVAGLVCGYISLSIVVIAIVFVLALFGSFAHAMR
jgi:hypothetical protein